jgi:hypothetical protein
VTTYSTACGGLTVTVTEWDVKQRGALDSFRYHTKKLLSRTNYFKIKQIHVVFLQTKTEMWSLLDEELPPSHRLNHKPSFTSNQPNWYVVSITA